MVIRLTKHFHPPNQKIFLIMLHLKMDGDKFQGLTLFASSLVLSVLFAFRDNRLLHRILVKKDNFLEPTLIMHHLPLLMLHHYLLLLYQLSESRQSLRTNIENDPVGVSNAPSLSSPASNVVGKYFRPIGEHGRKLASWLGYCARSCGPPKEPWNAIEARYRTRLWSMIQVNFICFFRVSCLKKFFLSFKSYHVIFFLYSMLNCQIR
ncbi:uncharacterized protein LOC110661290 isoform X1 [Hevea brasiliensis]|uniref:uncharacterized protein LOC110661290 isoform X1 n=1 Tax=Hevea brasiliensis TaxID=3981 RepID=UPI0025E31654|nr:uncharacterized protein LOC110661290 isoform X1 [Hevea brasiliensis]